MNNGQIYCSPAVAGNSEVYYATASSAEEGQSATEAGERLSW